MKSNVIVMDKEILSQMDGLYGKAKFPYQPLSLSIAGEEKTYNPGSLKESSHVVVHYDLAQSFPSEQLAEAVKPTMSEFAQVHGYAQEFAFHQQAKAVEFSLSSLVGADMTNANTNLMKNLLKEWDDLVWFGGDGNFGYKGHPKGNVLTSVSLTYAALVGKVKEGLNDMKARCDITSADYGKIVLVVSAPIMDLLTEIDGTTGFSNLELFRRQFPGMTVIEAPVNLHTGGDANVKEFTMVLRPMVVLHRGAIPAMVSSAPKKHGMGRDDLYAYESAAVELQADHAIQECTFS